MPERIALSWSGGKDSTLALHALRSREFPPELLLTTVATESDRISIHGVRRELLELQAAAVGIPLEVMTIPPMCSREEYDLRTRQMLAGLPSGLDTVAFGDLFLADVRADRERLLARAGKRGVFPMWQRHTRALASSFVAYGYEARVVSVNTSALDGAFAGRAYDEAFIADLPPEVDPCGENGEFHTFVTDGPTFKSPVACSLGEIVERSGYVFADLVP